MYLYLPCRVRKAKPSFTSSGHLPEPRFTLSQKAHNQAFSPRNFTSSWAIKRLSSASASLSESLAIAVLSSRRRASISALAERRSARAIPRSVRAESRCVTTIRRISMSVLRTLQSQCSAVPSIAPRAKSPPPADDSSALNSTSVLSSRISTKAALARSLI